ncbi:hypothetical protein ACFVYR_37035 [Streptomyces sp. NPDC058284]|uniref:hypothetical protein n=1 Tax=unclassified Streptomyces TaxID=2593676 RepID=UPI00364B425B
MTTTAVRDTRACAPDRTGGTDTVTGTGVPAFSSALPTPAARALPGPGEYAAPVGARPGSRRPAARMRPAGPGGGMAAGSAPQAW